MRKVILIALLFAVSGCAQMQQQKLREQARAEQSDVRAECEAVFQLPAIQPLLSLIPIVAGDASLTQMGDTHHVSDDQKAAIDALNTNSRKCIAMQSAWFGKFVGPAAQASYDSFSQQSKAALAELWADKISFGEYNTARAKLYAEFKSRGADIDERSRQQAAAREESDRQMALQYLMTRPVYQPTPVQPYVVPVPKTYNTNCSSFGGYTNCTTR